MNKKNVTLHGQTLIEVMVTLVFIGLGVVALIKFQNSLAYDTAVSQQRGDATILARSTLETLRDFQVLNNTNGYTSYQSIASGGNSSAITNANYTINWTVTAYNNPTYKNINVIVSWTDRNNNPQQIELISNVAGLDPSSTTPVM